MFSNQFLFSKDLVFNVFNIAIVAYKVNAKYSIKNNNKEEGVFFLPAKNQRRARTSSRISLRLKAIIRCMVPSAWSFFCPREKI